MGKQSFLKGAFILVFASFIVKILGFLYHVTIIRIIGTEGIGIFNMIYPLYTTALVLTTAGLPLAISKYVAEETACDDNYSAEILLGKALAILLIFSLVVSLFLIVFAPKFLQYLYADPRVTPCFLILVPSLLLVAISSAIRSYFQGLQNMRPTAFSQLLEQIIRFISGISLVYFLYPYGLTLSAAGLALAILLSEIGGFIYIRNLFIKTSQTKKFVVFPTCKDLKKLLAFGLPITITRIVITLTTVAEASLIPHQLITAGKSLSEATAFYGELSGVALTLIFLPSTLSFSLSTTLVPAVSEAQSKKQSKLLKQRTTDALGVTILAGIPSAIILFLYGPTLAQILFKAHQASFLIQILSTGSIFLYISQTASGILQGIGNVKLNFATTLLGGLMRLAGIYFWGSDPQLGIFCIGISFVVGFVVSALLKIIIIKVKTGFSLEKTFYLRLFFASILLISLLYLTASMVQGSILFLLGNIFFALACFFFFMVLTGDKYSRLIFQQLLQLIKRT